MISRSRCSPPPRTSRCRHFGTLGIDLATIVAIPSALVAPLPDGAVVVTRLPAALEFAHVFATRAQSLAAHLQRLRRTLQPTGTVWVSWPKRASGVGTDVTEDAIRALALPLGFVDVKVCAISDVWSGLKLMVRKSERGGWAWAC